jgi:DNA-binding transcriptional MocR family regulator
MRLGFVTAPIPLWQKLVYHQQVTSMHASSLSQVKFQETKTDLFAFFLLISRW